MSVLKTALRILSTSVVWLAVFPACVTDSVEKSPVGESDWLLPFHAASFDHEPTRAELEHELMSFLAAGQDKDDHGVVYPGSGTFPSVGYKLVTLTVRTGDNTDDGTDNAPKAYFQGTWLANSGSVPAYTERFVLDYPGQDDLDRGDLDVFYYQLKLKNYVSTATSDVFQRGRIGNTSSDRWRCQSIWVDERNYLGNVRGQNLPFNTSVQSPSPIESGDLLATDLSSLYYGG